MASLADTINNNLSTGKRMVRTSTGQLVEESIPQTELAAGQGTAPAITPGGAAMQGASPDVAKMAGTPNQLSNAVRQSLDGQTTLQKHTADKQPRTQMTPEEEARKVKQQQIQQQLGATGSRVQDMVAKQEQNLATATATGMKLPAGIIPKEGVDPAVAGAAWAAVINAAPGTKAQTDAVIALRGMLPPDVDTVALNTAIEKAKDEQSKKDTGAAAADTVVDTIKVKDVLTDLGTTAEDLADTLGITVDQVNNMDINQLNTMVNSLAQGTGQIDAAAVNDNLSAAERGALRDAAKDASATGMAASDQQLLDLGTELESADIVTFLGKSGTLKDLLSDKEITDRIDAMMVDGSWEKLPDTDPLKQFIIKYKEALTTTGNTAIAGVTEVQKIQDDNVASVKFGETTLDPAVVQALTGIDMGSLQNTRIDPNSNPVLAALKGITNPVIANTIAQQINQNPEMIKELAALSKEQVDALGMGKEPVEGTGWGKYMKAIDNKKKWATIDKRNPDAVVDFFLGPGRGAEAAEKIKDNARRRAAGLPEHGGFDMLDEDGDGVIDDLGKLSANIEGRMNPATLRQAANGKSSDLPVDYLDPSGFNRELDELQGGWLKIFDDPTIDLGNPTAMKQAAANGKVNYEQLVSMSKQPWAPDRLVEGVRDWRTTRHIARAKDSGGESWGGWKALSTLAEQSKHDPEFNPGIIAAEQKNVAKNVFDTAAKTVTRNHPDGQGWFMYVTIRDSKQGGPDVANRMLNEAGYKIVTVNGKQKVVKQ